MIGKKTAIKIERPNQQFSELNPDSLPIRLQHSPLGIPPLLAQNTNTNALPLLTNTNSVPLSETSKYQAALENDRSLGERAILPSGVKEKMKLTDAQRTELKAFEDDFANTSRQYQAANQSRIDSAQEANRRARASKDVVQIQAARKQLQDV